MKFSP